MPENIHVEVNSERNEDSQGLRFIRLGEKRVKAELNTENKIPDGRIDDVIKIICRNCPALVSCLPSYLENHVVEGTHAGTIDCTLAAGFVSEKELQRTTL